MESNNLEELLEYIDPASLSYQEWVNVGMALKEEGYPMETWRDWSATDAERYDGTEFEEKWDSFRRHDVTGGTIVAMAKDRGWSPEKKLTVYMTGTDKYKKTFSWEGPATEDLPKFKEPDRWKPAQDLIKYLELMFEPSETIGYTMQSTKNKKGKYVPAGKGSYTNNVGQLIDMLKDGEPIEKVFGSYDPEAGAWIRINPLDGKGIDDKNVTDYRTALIECDNLPIDEQIEILEKIKIPIRAMVFSGSKSVHALVPVNAVSEAEYRFKFNFIKNMLKISGMAIDSANINPSRLSRLPGVTRGTHKQFLIKTNIGMESFDDWKEWVAARNDGLPEIINLKDVWNNLPPLKPELIEGILRQGHKMIVASTSKAGKTFILIELAVAIAEGMTWIGHKCKRGKVLYINMELDEASFLRRIRDIYLKLGMNHDNHVENLDIWNLRGHGKPLAELAPIIINRMKDNDYQAVMIDPLYKVMDGDENSNGDVARMVSSFDRIAEETGAAVIYAHHFAKGNSSGKSIIDRAAGAGTFARDPDAILTMTQIDWAPAIEAEKDWTAWRVESTLREFKAIQPVDLFFDWPIHKVDYDGRLIECDLLSSENNRRSQIVLKDQKDELREWIAQCEITDIDGTDCFRFSDLMDVINTGRQKPMARGTLDKRLREAGYSSISRGFWGKPAEID